MNQLRLYIVYLLSLFLIFTTAFRAANSDNPNPSNPTLPTLSESPGPFITHSRQLTFEGRRSGEGYFSRDGSEIVFQSERFKDNPFYQIFKLNLKTGKTSLISTGKGQTTCAWIHPSNKKIMFSSTHLDPQNEDKVKAEIALRQQPTQKYSWNFDENYDIFEKDLKSGGLKNLTHTKGYDAEGAYSPDGQWIVFASNRSAYAQSLDEATKKHFEKDGSYLMDIYIMKADGTGVRKLTDHLGYDGGPFFSADGSQIAWRRFSPDGRTAEIYSMKRDGSEQKALTHLNVMSWAPFFHPSGEYLIFTSNLLGFHNFELFIVDAKGLQNPVRVTFEEGFDGLPVFSPDGKHLSWTKRNNKGESQLYLAEWNHDEALRSLHLAPKPMEAHSYTPAISQTDLSKTIYSLASEALEGRLTGSPGESTSTNQIAALFKAWGLKPGSMTTNFIHSFQFLSNVELGTKNNLLINQEALSIGKDWNPVSFSPSGTFNEGDLVFAGYGMKAPATDKFTEYNSYKNLDVKDKWVVVFRDIPNDIEGEFRYHLNFYSRIQHKATVAKNLGAKGLLILSGPRVAYKQKLPPFQFEGSMSDSSLPIINISDSVFEKILKPSGRDLEALQKSLDDGSLVDGFNIEKAQVKADIDIRTVHSKGHNVIAKLAIPDAKKTLIIGAHGDHLGRGLPGVSLATVDMKNQIHFGADDNASGVAAVLELAHYFSVHKSKLKTNLIFAIWSGEELGNLGSKTYIQDLNASKDPENLLAYINLDMVGRLKDNLYVQGVGSSSSWKSLLEHISVENPIPVVSQEDPYLPTDAMSFYVEAKIPVVSLFTGSHKEYHTPLDVPSKINFAGLESITNWAKTLVNLASSAPLSYQSVESQRANLPGRKTRIYLGTIPDYSQEGVKGVKISGTSEKSPAERAGLKSGDIIVEIGGQKIENLYDMVYFLQSAKPDQEVPIKLRRQEAMIDLKITPGVKE